jgi:hypothetical protein
MESDKIYEKSRAELLRLSRALSGSGAIDKVTIDFSEMDTDTRGFIKQALVEKIQSRLHSVDSIITGVR